MSRTGRTTQVSTEMRRYNIAVLGLCETRWTQSGQIHLSTGDTLLYSGHEEDNSPHTEGVGLMLSASATASLIEWTPVSSRIVLARFRSKTRNVQIVQCYAPSNDADDDLKTDFYEQLQATFSSSLEISMRRLEATTQVENIAIGGSLFRQKLIHKSTWISPDYHTENQMSAEEKWEKSKTAWKKACDVVL